VYSSGAEGRETDVIAGLVYCGVSLTLEVSEKGNVRWFLTKESGLGCSGCGDRSIVGRGIVPYAVLKTYPLPDVAGRERNAGQCFLKPLCACSVKMLLQVASDVQGAAEARGDITACVVSVKRALGFGRSRRPTGLGCEKLATLKCRLCAEYGSKWCAAGRYQSDGRRMQLFFWFNGVTDAVGTVEVCGAREVVRWLSCPNRRYV
jgi:hypothetical protein